MGQNHTFRKLGNTITPGSLTRVDYIAGLRASENIKVQALRQDLDHTKWELSTLQGAYDILSAQWEKLRAHSQVMTEQHTNALNVIELLREANTELREELRKGKGE